MLGGWPQEVLPKCAFTTWGAQLVDSALPDPWGAPLRVMGLIPALVGAQGSPLGQPDSARVAPGWGLPSGE